MAHVNLEEPVTFPKPEQICVCATRPSQQSSYAILNTGLTTVARAARLLERTLGARDTEAQIYGSL